MKRTREVNVEKEAIYLNLNYTNNSDKSVQLQVNETLSGPIVSDGRERLGAVVSFVLNGQDIPFFVFKDATYWVSLKYLGIVYSQAVVYQPDYRFDGVNTVYSYQSMLNMINTAYGLCYRAIVLAVGNPPSTTQAPFLVLESEGNYTTPLYAEAGYLDTAVNGVTIFMNSALYAFFQCFWSKFNGQGLPDHTDYQIVVHSFNGLNLSGSLYRVMNEFSPLSYWYDITQIVIMSNGMGANPEYVPTTNISLTQLTSSYNAGGGPASVPIIKMFAPYFNCLEPCGPRGNLFFAQQGPYQFFSINQDKINSVDMDVYFRTHDGSLYPFFIPPASSFSMKIMFLLKEYAGGQIGGK